MKETNARIKNMEVTSMELYRILMVFLLTLGTFPISISLISTNVDNSGLYLLNMLDEMGLKFGTDLMFTYGPLGFLYHTQNIGNNALISIVFYGLLTVAEIWLLWCTFRRLKGLGGAVLMGVSLLLLLSGVHLWSKDYYICFLFFLAVSLAWVEKAPHRYLLFASVLTVIALLIKFNTGVQCVATLVLFVAGKLLVQKRAAYPFLYYIPSVFFSYSVVFLLYNPSLKALGHYISTNLEIASGYNTALSIVPNTAHLLAAILCGGCFCLFLIFVFTADFNSGIYLFLLSGALFQTFKHGYVRADAHVYIFFMGFLMIITVMALFLDFNRLLSAIKKVRFYAGGCMVFVAVMLGVSLYALNPSIQGIVQIFPNKVNDIRYGIPSRLAMKVAPSNEDTLPENVLNAIGQDTVAVLPGELSIDAYNDINMVVMPAIQSLMAYTPALDTENAEFFVGSDAPEYVIFTFFTIDGRTPLLETPATWKALYENYDAILYEEPYLLLKKAEVPSITRLGAPEIQTYDSSARIALPTSDNGTFVRVETDLTLWGKLNKLFYQIPPVSITLTYSDGTQSVGRVLPEMLGNGIIMDFLPASLSSMCLTMNDSGGFKNVVTCQFSGEGWKYYQDTMTVSFQSVLSENEPYHYSPYEEIRLTQAADPTTDKVPVAQIRTFWVDLLNGAPLQEQTAVEFDSGLNISGWALDDPTQGAAQAVYLLLGGKYYQFHATDRGDVCEAYFGNRNGSMCGFAGWLPLDDYPAGVYPLSLILICDGGTTYYRADVTTVSIL